MLSGPGRPRRATCSTSATACHPIPTPMCSAGSSTSCTTKVCSCEPRRGRRRAGRLMPLVAVIGGGIAGLAAARELSRAGLEVVVFEGSDRWGGKIDSAVLDGVRVDTGAESMLARRPEPVALIDALGLADRLVHPTPAAPELLVGGGLHPLPRSVSGVPTDLDQLSGLVSPLGLARARREPASGRSWARTWPSAGSSTSGWGERSPIGWWSRCSAGSMPDAPARCHSLRSRPHCSSGSAAADHWSEQARAVAEEAPAGPVFAGLKGGLTISSTRWSRTSNVLRSTSNAACPPSGCRRSTVASR